MHIPMVRLARRLLCFLRERSVPASYMDVERAEQTFYIQYLREGMTVFDVGANVGELALLFSRFVGERGRVYAFEAGNGTFQRLTTLCQVAAVRNVSVNHLALADKEGSVHLHVYEDDHSGWNSLAQRPLQNYEINVKPVRTEEVVASTVDAYCEMHGIGNIDLLKIDVEGAEYQVLLGARRMLQARRIRCCTFEFGKTTFDMGNSPDEIEAYLMKMGYRVSNIVKGDPVFPGRADVGTAQFSMHVAVAIS